MDGQSRNWHVTVNNSSEVALVATYAVFLNTLVAPAEGAMFTCVAGQPERGTSRHLQIFLQTCKKIRPAALLRKLPPGVHLERMVSTVTDSLKYVSKDDTYDPCEDMERFCHGDADTMGRRHDLEELANSLAERSTTVFDIASDAPSQFVKYHRGLMALQETLALPYSGGEKQVLVYYGPTGTGKTRQAFQEHPGAYFWGPELGKWFQGYKGETVTILDEFRGQLPFGFLLRLTDRYPMQVEFKGSSTQFVSSKIIVCSPVHPKHWYLSLAQSEGKYDQLMRRISSIKWFGDGPEPDPDIMPDVSAQFGQ
jgi:hypothetical protein